MNRRGEKGERRESSHPLLHRLRRLRKVKQKRGENCSEEAVSWVSPILYSHG